MNFDPFVGQAQHARNRADTGEAIRAVRGVLLTLSERLAGREAKGSGDLASRLPQEIGYDLVWNFGLPAEGFDLNDFIRRRTLVKATCVRRTQ